ncbi:MAG: putative amidophosphoribosyltransferase [Bacteriovoracaceae bacterium]|jgi:predicted amidophosphoribosyltransferase
MICSDCKTNITQDNDGYCPDCLKPLTKEEK